MPYGARCSFEENWCGWYNVDAEPLQWQRHNGSTPTNYTGPNFDHTYMNTTGNYIYVNMLKEDAKFSSRATLNSVIFNPPPRVHGNLTSKYYNSCAVSTFPKKIQFKILKNNILWFRSDSTCTKLENIRADFPFN